MTRPVIMDCDPGTDDALAIMLALAADDMLDVAGITAIVGNAPLNITVANASRICELAGRRDVPVFAGCERPILMRPEAATYLHGTNAAKGNELLMPGMEVQDAHGVDFIIDTVLSRPGEVVMCCTGPLTNLALAIIKTPLVAERVGEIVIFGGVARTTKVTDSAAFNFQVDAHAASVVLGSGAPISIVALPEDASVIATPDRVKLLSAMGGPVGDAIADLLETFEKSKMKRFASPAAPLHEPCNVAYLLWPELFKTLDIFVSVDTADGVTFGEGNVDLNGITGMSPNAKLQELVDPDTMVAMLSERLTRLAALAL